MKRPHLNILLLSVILGTFLRLYRLTPNYVWFNDTFFRLTPALEILKGVPVNFDSSMLGATAVGLFSFSIIESLSMVSLVIAFFGIICIPLSYLFSLKLTGDEKASAIVSLFVSINPTFVALSKVLIWDIFVLFFFLVSGIIFLSFRKEGGLKKGVALSFSLFLLFLFKLPNILYASVFYLFLFYSKGFSLDRSKEVLLSLGVYLSLLMVFFYFFPSTLRFFASAGGDAFFASESYTSIAIASLMVLSSPLASPDTSMAFSHGVTVNAFFFLGLLALIPVAVYFKSLKKSSDLFPLLTLIIVSLFYINYTGWSHRYLVVPIFLMLLFASQGILAIAKNSKMLAAFLLGICILSSLGPASIMTEQWGSNSSLARNHIATPLSLFDEVSALSEAEGVDVIASSYGRVFTFYKLSGTLDATVLDFYQMEKKDVLEAIELCLLEGKKVWYVQGWRDIYTSNTGSNTIPYKNSIEDTFSLRRIYTSKERIYLIDHPYPSLTIYELSNKD